MNSGSGKRCDLPQDFFSDDEPVTAKEIVRPRGMKPPSRTAAKDDDEFLKLVSTTSKKIVDRAARRKAKPKTIAASSFDRSLVEVDEMIRSGDWDNARASHLVALYDRLHVRCYKVECTELGPSERYNAAMMAANVVKRHFGGEYVEAAAFMRWVWEKEIKDEKWRRDHERFNARRIGYRLMFSGSMITDYRLYLARRSHNT